MQKDRIKISKERESFKKLALSQSNVLKRDDVLVRSQMYGKARPYRVSHLSMCAYRRFIEHAQSEAARWQHVCVIWEVCWLSGTHRGRRFSEQEVGTVT